MKGRVTLSQTWLALKTEHVLEYFKSQPLIESHQQLWPFWVLAFLVAAILEICKLGIFHPLET